MFWMHRVMTMTNDNRQTTDRTTAKFPASHLSLADGGDKVITDTLHFIKRCVTFVEFLRLSDDRAQRVHSNYLKT